MDNNDPLIKYGHVIILLCITIMWGLVSYLEYFLYKDENDE